MPICSGSVSAFGSGESGQGAPGAGGKSPGVPRTPPHRTAGGEGGAGVLPPPTNRGVTVAWMGVHWFAGTTRLHPWNEVLDVLSGFLGASAVLRDRGGYGYACSAAVGAGSVYWSPGRADVFVVLPGEACEVLGVPALVALATELDLDPSSRLDLAWDVHGVAVHQVADAWHAGNVVTRAHRESWQDHQNAEGRTFYMGSRASGRMVRVYDRRGPTRFEMEWKGERAVLLWRRLLACAEEGWSLAAMSELRAFLDFRDRSSGVRPDCCPLLPWWEEMTVGAGRSCVSIPREARTLEDKRAWLRHQVAPVLAMVADGVADWTAELRRLLDNGRERYTRRPDRVAMVQMARAG